MPDPLAQQLVTELRALGLNDSAIGKAVALDSSAIAQIAGTSGKTGAPLAKQRGAGYGQAATPALQALRDQVAGFDSTSRRQAVARGVAASGEVAAKRQRRTTKAGRTARVRQGTRTVGKSGQGALLSGAGAGKGAAFDRLLARASRADQEVSIRVNMDMGAGGTRWVTLKAAPASFWQDLRDGWDEEDGDLADWLGEVMDGLASEGELSSELGDVIGYAVQVAA